MGFSCGSGSSSIAGGTDVALSNPAGGDALVYNSSLSKWQNLATTASSGLTSTAVQTASYTASANQLVPVDAASGTLTISLPTAPSDKSRITIKKIDSSTNVVTVTAGGGDVFNKASGSTSLSLTLLNQAITVQYASVSAIWYVVGDDLPLSALNAQYVSKGSQVINVVDAPYLADLTGGTDTTAAVQAAINAGAAAGMDVVFPAGVYKLNGGITWNAIKHSLLGLGDVRLNFGSCTANQAILITGTGVNGLSNSYGHRGTMHVLRSFTIEGADTDASTVDGIVFNDTAGEDAVSIEHCRVYGFRDNITLMTNTWLNSFVQVMNGHAHRYGVNLSFGANAGENTTFIGGGIYGAGNANGNAAAVYSSPTAALGDTNFFGSSFDYNNYEIVLNSGSINLHGCHIENRNSTPMIQLSYTGGSPQTSLSIFGGTFNPTEASPGRDHLIEFVSGDNIRLACDGVRFNTYNQTSDIVKVLAGTGTASFINSDVELGTAPLIARYGQVANLFGNPGFESAQASWQLNQAAGYTWTFNSTNSYQGTYAAKVVGAAAAGVTARLYQAIPTPGNTRVYFSARMAADSITAGNLSMVVSWYYPENTLISKVTISGSTISANQGFTVFGGSTVSPPGAAYGQFGFVPLGLTGNIYIDDAYLAIQVPVAGNVVTFGTSAGQAAQGNDTRVTGALQKANNLSDIASPATALANLGAVGSSNIQVFTANATWTMPIGAKSVNVICIGPGGGGGAGARGPSGTALSGGGGGGGGGVSMGTFQASLLASTVSVVVGTGGTAVAGQTTDSTAGANGNAATNASIFGPYIQGGRGGVGGGGGLSVAGASGIAGAGSLLGSAGGIGSASGGAGTFSSSGAAGAPGGGSGGGITTVPAANSGGNSSVANFTAAAVATGGSAGGGAGGNGTSSTTQQVGNAGAGGGANTSGAGGNGGNGGNYGAGGGGGGASLNGNISGAGGAGGDGIVVVTTYF